MCRVISRLLGLGSVANDPRKLTAIQRAKKAVIENPKATIWKLAEIAGVDPGTVTRAKKRMREEMAK